MRAGFALIPLSLCAAPALAQAAPPAAIQLPPQLTDPATADRLADAMQAMSKAFLDLPVGQVQAALEGRRPTRVEQRLTVRDLGRRDDPNFDRKFEQKVAEARPMMRQSMKALNEALPGMIQGLQQAQQSLQRAVANLPDPTYPKR